MRTRMWALAAAMALLLLPAAAAYAASNHDLADEFMCQCGCGLTLANCSHESCGPRDQMLGEIGRLFAAGRTPLQIRAALIAQFGEAVLSAPPRSGFNLLAYWGPYAALAGGALLIAVLSAAWSKRRGTKTPDAVDTLTPEQRAMLTRELEQFED